MAWSSGPGTMRYTYHERTFMAWICSDGAHGIGVEISPFPSSKEERAGMITSTIQNYHSYVLVSMSMKYLMNCSSLEHQL